jgi:predicted DNA-binding transcriptional regulator YafY
MTAAELAGELEVSERTVQRDVAALAEAGVPVFAERGRAGGYRLVDGYRTRLTGLQRDEAEVLLLAGMPGPLREMGLAGRALAARLKVAAALGDAPGTATQRFHLDAPGWFRTAETPPLLGPISRAVWDDRIVRATYRTKHGGRARTLEPYGLVLKGGLWYLVARVDAGYRTYRVDRFDEVDVDDGGFERDPVFDLAAYWAEKSAEFARSLFRERITVRVSPTGVERMRILLEPAAVDEALGTVGEPDESGWVTVRLPVESLEIGYDDVLHLGPDAEVLDPPELRERVARAGRAMAALYGDHR